MTTAQDFLTPLSPMAKTAEIQERNMAFWAMLNDEGATKTAQEVLVAFLKAQLYEGSICEAYQKPVPLKWTDLDRDVNPENVYRVEDREFISSPAVQLTLRGTPNYERVETDRYKLRLVQFSSPQYFLKEQEVKTMRQPIEEVLRTQITFHLRKKIDAAWYGYLRAAINAVSPQQVHDTSSSGVKKISPEFITDVKNLIDGRGIDGKYLSAHTLVMTKSQFNNISVWPQTQAAGGPGSVPGVYMNADTNFLKYGYREEMLQGMRVLVTMKNDLLPNNYVWVLPSPEYLGHHYTMQDEKFGIVRKFDGVELRGWMSWMYGIGNAYGVGLGILAS